MDESAAASGIRKTRKRSKSLGPGGLEALNAQRKAGESLSSAKGKKRRESMAPTLQSKSAPSIKSILLPTVPVSPVRAAPTRATGRRRTSLLNIPGLNIPPKPTITVPAPGSTGSDGMTRSIPLRTEEEQAAAARERQKKDILASRAERRKSLGNRRVSFATEATLHTFVIDDYPATPSSAGASSRNSTPGVTSEGRRQSGASGIDTPEPMKGKRRNSKPNDISSGSEDENEAFSSSPIAADGLGRLVEPGQMQGADSDSDSDSASDSGSDFGNTLGSKKGDKKDYTFPNILPIDFDDDEEMAMDLVKDRDEDITLSAKGMKGYFKKPIRVIQSDTAEFAQPCKTKQRQKQQQQKSLGMEHEDFEEKTMDLTRPLGLASSGGGGNDEGDEPPSAQGDGEMMMDITRPIGGLISSMRNAAKEFQQHLEPSMLFGGSNAFDESEMTMDITMSVGGLLSQSSQPTGRDIGGFIGGDHPVQYPQLSSSSRSQGDADGDVTMDMDITRPIGGLRRVLDYPSLPKLDDDGNMTMDITRPVGKILEAQNRRLTRSQQAQAQAQSFDDQTMDLTVAVGGIKGGTEDWSSDEGADGLDGEETMELTAVVGSGVVQKSGARGRRMSSLGTVQLQSVKEWEKGQDMERQLQSELNAQLGIEDNARFSAGENKGKGKAETTGDKDGDIDMDFDEDAEMDLIVTIPRQIQQFDQSEEAILPKVSPPRLSTSPKESPTQPATKATPVSLFYGSGGKSVSALPSPGGGWIPPLKRKTASASKTNTPTTGPENAKALAKIAAIAAAQESPIRPKKQDEEVPEPAQRSETPKKRATRSSTARGRSSLAAPEVAMDISADASPEPAQSSDTLQQASARKAKSAVLVTPTRPYSQSQDGFTFSARRRLAEASNPSTPKNASAPRRRLSGIGIDKPGLGSPSILATLGRRRSIGENSPFRVGIITPREVLFESLRAAAEEKAEEKRKANEAHLEEKKRFEVAKDETVSLKQRIRNMTPRKSAPTTTKTGAERKRLSWEFEEDGEASQVKRDLFGEFQVGWSGKKATKKRSLGLDKPAVPVVEKQSSAKQTREKRKTTSRASLHNAPASTPKPKRAVVVVSPPTSPEKKPALAPKLKKAEEEGVEPEKVKMEEVEVEEAEFEEVAPMFTMQQFLEKTGISFLDNITHTKRRQTFAHGIRKAIVPGPSALFKKSKNGSKPEPTPTPPSITDDYDEREPSLGDWIVAGAATTAVYSLFWSSCRELKNYIDEGKRQMKTIEDGINSANPKLFKEYMDAPADLKLIMDSQFKSIKTHSRLLAKRDWYNWRTEQLRDLNRQLSENLTGLRKDEEMIAKQKEVIDGTLPKALTARAEMKRRLEALVDRRKEVESSDPVELEMARKRLVELRTGLEKKRDEVAKKRDEAVGLERGIEERKERMQKLKQEIDEAERVKEMNRGFTEEEVWALRSSVRKLEKQYGWSIVSVDRGSILTMSYKSALLLTFDAAPPRKASSRISPIVQYIFNEDSDGISTQYPPLSLNTTTSTSPPLAEHAYLLEALQKKLIESQMKKKSPRELVKFVSSFWDKAEIVVGQIAGVRGKWVTMCSYGDGTQVTTTKGKGKDKILLTVAVKVILPEIKSRVNVTFTVDGSILGNSIEDASMDDEKKYADMVDVSAKVMYFDGGLGKKATETAINGTLQGNMMGSSVVGEEGSWRDAVEDVLARCFVGVGDGGKRGGKKLPQQQQQEDKENQKGVKDIEQVGNTRTPKRTRGQANLGKKIPVRSTYGTPVTTSAGGENGAESATSAYSTRSAAGKMGSSIPKPTGMGGGTGSATDQYAFEKVSAPFGTGKRGIPVPTKAGHEEK